MWNFGTRGFSFWVYACIIREKSATFELNKRCLVGIKPKRGDCSNHDPASSRWSRRIPSGFFRNRTLLYRLDQEKTYLSRKRPQPEDKQHQRHLCSRSQRSATKDSASTTTPPWLPTFSDSRALSTILRKRALLQECGRRMSSLPEGRATQPMLWLGRRWQACAAAALACAASTSWQNQATDRHRHDSHKNEDCALPFLKLLVFMVSEACGSETRSERSSKWLQQRSKRCTTATKPVAANPRSRQLHASRALDLENDMVLASFSLTFAQYLCARADRSHKR